MGYKQTEVGIIPQDWDHVRVGDVAKVKGGKRLPAGFVLADTPTPYPYVRVTDMYPGGVDQAEVKYVPEQAFPTIQSYRIYSEDIFISVAGTLGIVGVIPPELSGANLTENADRITDLQCDRDYLKYWLMSHPIQQTIESIRTVGAQPKLALGQIAKFGLAIPRDTDEQHAIAEVLSDVDGLLAALEELIAKKRAVKQAAMQQLLTGKTRLPGFSEDEDWGVLELQELCTHIVDGTHYTPRYVPDGIPFYSVENVTADDFTNVKYISENEHNLLIRRCNPQRGDILLTRIGSLGDTKLIDWDVNASIYVSLAILKLGKCADSEYIYHYTILRTVFGCRRFFEINKLDEARCFILNLGLHPEFDKKTDHSINLCFIET